VQSVEFSRVSDNELSKLGIDRRLMVINQDALAQRLKDSAHGDLIKKLCIEITLIFDSVSSRVREHHSLWACSDW
jgi:hypothetical protein